MGENGLKKDHIQDSAVSCTDVICIAECLEQGFKVKNSVT